MFVCLFVCSLYKSKLSDHSIDIEIKEIDCLRFVMCPLLVPPDPRLFSIFILWLFTVIKTQTRQVVHAIKQSISLDVYGLFSAKLGMGIFINEEKVLSWVSTLYPNPLGQGILKGEVSLYC
jgi:hypothetical protein